MIKKAIRTAQNFFPQLAELKNEYYYFLRSKLGFVHESQFSIIAQLPARPDDLFLDVGANRGQSILAIRRFRKDARIISFEPNPLIFQRLARKFGETAGVTLEPFGLGAGPSSQTLYVPTYGKFVYDGLGTFAADKARAFLNSDTLYFFDPVKVSVSEFVCEARTLDSLDLAPTFIKVDVEGFEDQFLEGSRATLRRHEPILMIERFYENHHLREILTELGYQEVVWRDGRFSPGASHELNMFWVTPRRMAALAA